MQEIPELNSPTIPVKTARMLNIKTSFLEILQKDKENLYAEG